MGNRRPFGCAIAIVAMTMALPSYAQDSSGPSRRVGLTGGLSASFSQYNSNQEISARDPFTWLFMGNATLRLEKWTMPFSITVSQQRKDISTPTFARIGASPTWKWGKAHIGYRTMRFSEFTVGGTTFLGGGLELNPGLLRFAALGGRFADAREDDPIEGIRARYERRGYGFKLGVGSAANYVDLIYFSASDDTTSLEMAPLDPRTTPRENLVLGLNMSFSPVQSLSVFAEAAASALNRDSRSDEIETGVSSILNSLFQPRESAQANLATRAGIDFNQAMWGLRVEFLRVDPDYQTLGSYFFNTDVQSITVAPRGTFAGGRVNISASGGFSRNNLYDDLAQTTERVIGSANLMLRISRAFRIGGLFSNYSSDQSSGVFESTDSTRVKNVSRNFMLTPQFQFGREVRHSIGIRAQQQDYEQTSVFTGIDNNTRTRQLGGNYSIDFRESDLRFRVSVTNLNSETSVSEVTTRSVSGGLTKGLADGKLSIDLRISYRRRDLGTGSTFSNVSSIFGISFNPSRFDSFALRSQYSTRSARTTGADSPNELMTTFTYSRRFSI